jgi:malate synthase
VYDDSKDTTLPIAREIVETYLSTGTKLPWYIDLLNINLNNHDLTEARRRIQRLVQVFIADGTRLTENLDFS